MSTPRHGARVPGGIARVAVALLGATLATSMARGSAWAQDAAPAPAPTEDSQKEAELRRATEIHQQVLQLHRAGRYADAIPLAREVLAIRERALGGDHQDVGTSLDSLAALLQQTASYAEAKSLFERALSIFEKALGQDHPYVATSLNNLSSLLYEQGAYAEARPLLERALAILEKALGRDHPDVATCIDNLAGLLHDQGAYAEARPLLERALAIREKALGGDHPDVAYSLYSLALLLADQGAYAEARPLHERALAIREKALGKDHPDVARSLNSLAVLLKAQGAYAEARPLLERALAIREKTRGTDHPDVAHSLDSLALLLKAQGAYAEARPLLERALAIREKAFGRDHPAVAASLYSLAVLLHAQGAYAEARTLYERALGIQEKALGEDHPDVARSLDSLAVLSKAQGAYAEAGPLLERALAIREKAFGKDHPDVANSLNGLATLLHDQGAYAEAKRLYERALEIRERALGKDHPDVAESLNNLAELLRSQGAYAEARPLCERALEIQEKARGEAHPLVATSLNNLASILQAQGAYAEAKPLCERALSIREKAFGEDHPDVANSLNNLATLLHDSGAYAEARPLYERALAIREKALGKDHPDVAESLDNLAELLRSQGAYTEARPLYQRALEIDERLFGPNHAHVALDLKNLAVLLHDQGAYTEARPRFERALALTESRVRAQFASLSASQRLALVRSTRHFLDQWLGFAPREGISGHGEALRFRGLVARASAAERALARGTAQADRRSLADLEAATRRATRLANEVPATRDPAARATWQQRYAEAAAERERLSRDLTAKVAGARVALERLDLTVADVQKALPPDAALLDLLRVRDRYLGWVLRPTGEAVRVEVGAADAIEAACEVFVTAIADDAGDDASREAVAKAGTELRALVWAPLEARLGDGVARVVICPDAALASVPFAALPGKAPGASLCDDLAIAHVFHPFDLVPRRNVPPSGVGALVVGGVDYDRADAGSKERPLPARPPVFASLDRAPTSGSFSPIPATRAEAEALRDRFGADATTLLHGTDATEARVREGVKGKRFVHVATHGFARTDLLAGLHDRKVKDSFLSADAERMLSAGHDPMLLSGLALAGANPRDGAGGDDGILTALEASYLDLEGVDLVTLSACETARGTAESGEGVLGLVSAFQLAGAHRVLASLWKVDDEATRLLMEGVYERLLRKEDPLAPADALRASALALRHRKDAAGKARFAAPRYWAAFIAYGG